MEYRVYVLYSEALSRYYVGQTHNIEKRLKVHNKGGKKYTTKGIPWILIKTYKCENRSKSIQLERKIKKRGINDTLKRIKFGMWRSPVSVHGWGPCGRRFKSCHPDKMGVNRHRKKVN